MFIVSVYDDLDSEALFSQTITDASDATFTDLSLQPYTVRAFFYSFRAFSVEFSS